jgi:hypothetical protein
MPDYTMCGGTSRKLRELFPAEKVESDIECPLRYECYRYLAEPEPQLQAWFGEILYRDGKCEVYGSVEKRIGSKVAALRIGLAR